MSSSVINSIINPDCLQPVPNPLNPTRLWSRYDNKCIRCNYSTEPSQIPGFTPIICTDNPSNYDLDMRRKAEVLQYKKNNAQLSKKQKWAQTVKGNGPGKNYVWATQTVSYTDPNIKNLPGRYKFSLLCSGVPVKCANPTQCDVPGGGPPICMDKDVPLTRYIPRRIYRAGGTKWPQRKWQPGDRGFPRWKSGASFN
jgi:hypothetical protein